MDILGIGPLEIVLFLIIALIVLGPKDIVKTSKTVGRFLRKVVTSPTWHAVQKTSDDIRTLPNRLIREAGLEEELRDINSTMADIGQIMPENNIRTGEEIYAEPQRKTHKPESDLQSGDFSDWITPPPDSIESSTKLDPP